jgi:predicted GH43/DUF377 family glycosyl hydrolase
MYITRRSDHNPFIRPNEEKHWMSYATFNWSPLHDKETHTIHALYRAMTKHDLLSKGPAFSVSSIGYTKSVDEEHFTNHTQLIFPEHEWERYGCEDPRVTKIDDTYYIFYTALSTYPFSADGIKVAVATTKDFKKIEEKKLVTPFNAKAMTLFPKKINGKFTALLTVDPDLPPSKIAFIQFDTEEQMWDQGYWHDWYAKIDDHIFDPRKKDNDHCEIGAAPVWTSEGWLLVYSHIQNYFEEDGRIFGIEALLLDHNDPKKIISRTTGPILVPEKDYEKVGQVKDITFPSGALIHDDRLDIYYGGADSVCCMASVNLKHLMESMNLEKRKEHVVRYGKNPILLPIREHEWESKLVFNPTTVDIGEKTYIIYRAMSEDNTSYMGAALTTDGYTIDERFPNPIYVPRMDFELKKSHPTGNSGCEDGRATIIDNILYMFYTAYNGIDVPKVAYSAISLDDFEARKWESWSTPQLVTPDTIDDKDGCLLPEKIKDEYAIFHRVAHHVCFDTVKTLDFSESRIDKCIPLIGPRHGMWDGLKVGIAGPPIKTKAGWLLLYHAVSTEKSYRVGAMLMELENPGNIIGRTTDFILEPEDPWEMEGEINRVVFPCGSSVRGDDLLIYYGGADSVIGVATTKLSWLLDILTWEQNSDDWS